MMDISNLLNYLHHVQSQTDEKYEPVTGDGLTERQLFEALEKSIADSKTSKCFTPEEVMESLRKQIEEYKENNPIAKLTLDFSKVEKTITISQSTFKVLSYLFMTSQKAPFHAIIAARIPPVFSKLKLSFVCFDYFCRFQ